MDFFEYREELEEGKLSKIAMVGALALGLIASSQAAHVKPVEVKNWQQTYNSLSVKQQDKVQDMMKDLGK